MNPRIRRKNKVLKCSAGTSVFLGTLSAMCLDSDSWIPIIVLAVCATYLLLFTMANSPRK